MPSLLDFMNEDKEPRDAEVTSGSEEQELKPEGQPEGGGEGGEEGKSSDGKSQWMREWLAKAGYDEEELEELSDEEIEQYTLQGVKGSEGSQAKPKEGDAPQAAKDGIQPEVPSSPRLETKPELEQKTTPVKSAEDELAKLEYDHSIAQLVKQEGGRYVPADDSPEAIAAAKEANGYNRKRQERLNKMLDDPKGTLGPWMRQEVDALLEQKLQVKLDELKKSQSEEARKAQEQQQLLAEERRWQELVEKNKNLLYKVGEDGNPRYSLKRRDENGKPMLMMTPIGRKVEEQFLELYELSPHQPQSVLLEKAIAIVKKYEKSGQQESVAKEPTGKKKEFLEKAKKADVDTDVSKKPASVSEAVELGASTSLLEAILMDQSNQDNQVVLEMKSRRS